MHDGRDLPGRDVCGRAEGLLRGEHQRLRPRHLRRRELFYDKGQRTLSRASISWWFVLGIALFQWSGGSPITWWHGLILVILTAWAQGSKARSVFEAVSMLRLPRHVRDFVREHVGWGETLERPDGSGGGPEEVLRDEELPRP